MGLSRDVVLRHLLSLEEAVAELKNLRDIPLATLESDTRNRWAVEHGLQIAIQNMVDVGAHLLVQAARNDWDDYTDILDRLARHGIISRELLDSIRDLPGMRNILVHEYLRVDLARLADVLASRLDAFEAFASAVRDYLDRAGSP